MVGIAKCALGENNLFDLPKGFFFGQPNKLGSREDAGVDVGIRLPISGAIGVAVNGVPIYPSFDNADYVVWEVCEGDACSSHAGKGGDYHYHGDPYGAYCMYNQV